MPYPIQGSRSFLSRNTIGISHCYYIIAVIVHLSLNNTFIMFVSRRFDVYLLAKFLSCLFSYLVLINNLSSYLTKNGGQMPLLYSAELLMIHRYRFAEQTIDTNVILYTYFYLFLPLLCRVCFFGNVLRLFQSYGN